MNRLLAPEGLWDTAMRLLKPFSVAATPQGRSALQHDATAHRDRELFNRLESELRDSASPMCPELPGECAAAFQELFASAVSSGLAAAKELASMRRQAWLDAQLRLRELLAAALDATEIADWCAMLSNGGVNTQVQTLTSGSHVMGWTLSGEKRA